MSSVPRVDVHHHIMPPQLDGVGEGLHGMKVPTWSIASDDDFNKSVGVHSAIFSVSTPGVTFIPDPEESAKVARAMNEYSASVRDENPSHGFFATVPSLEHTDLVLRELAYAFDTLHADGVTLFTSYATPGGYLGHAEYLPVWEELNRREAVVFVHPINHKDSVYFNDKLPMPAFDWPHETGRAAIDLILNRRLQQFPSVKIILSHGGGTLIALIKRASIISVPEFGAAMSAEDIIGQAKSFYFDLALSGSQEMLPLVLGFAKRGHVLFGSDFPHATAPVSKSFTDFTDEFPVDDAMRKEIYHEAAEKLFPRLKGKFAA